MNNTIQKAPKKKHISYSSREEYITDLEEMLMQKYRVGYSALHKRLVAEKSNQLLNRTIWSDQHSKKEARYFRLRKNKSEGRTVNW